MREAQDDLLDPADVTTYAHVLIEPWPGMAMGDIVDLTWTGTPLTGAPVNHTRRTSVTASGAGHVVSMQVPASVVSLLDGSSADVSYVVTPWALRWPAPSRVTPLPSGHLTLRIHSAASLAAPVVEGVLNGILDPDDVTADGVIVTVPQDVVLASRDRTVAVSYSVVLAAGWNGVSAVTTFTVGEAVPETLPAPSVLPAVDGVLDPRTMPEGAATVRTWSDTVFEDFEGVPEGTKIFYGKSRV